MAEPVDQEIVMDLIQLSQTIRKIRQAQNMTLEQLAAKSGFTKGFISQVENFRITPSLNALNKIGEALGTGLSGLFQESSPAPEFTFGKMDSGEELIRDEGNKYGIRYFALAYPQIGRIMDPFLVEYHRTGEERDFMFHETEEFFVLLEGRIEYYILTEEQVRIMEPGDTLYMKPNLPHKVRLADGCDYAKALITYSSGPENNRNP